MSQWLDWVVGEFGFNSVNRLKFSITGEQLCALSREELLDRAPPYTGDILFAHLNLLKARTGENHNHCKDFQHTPYTYRLEHSTLAIQWNPSNQDTSPTIF